MWQMNIISTTIKNKQIAIITLQCAILYSTYEYFSVYKNRHIKTHLHKWVIYTYHKNIR